MLQQLAKRRVLRVISGYAVVCFVILQIADVTFEPLAIDASVLRGMIAVMVISLPVIAYLAWIFDVEGAKPSVSAAPSRSTALEVTVAVACTLALSVFMWVQWRNTMPNADAESQVADSDQLSIVVLPFANLSADSEQAFFSEGLSEELMNVLSQLEGLRVISRTSAFSFKGRAVDTPSIARELNVSHVLEGSVRSNGEQVRITAQLVESSTDSQLWSETFDRSINDVFAVQDEIARAVAGELQVRLNPSGASNYVPSADVHRDYLKARHLVFQFTPTALTEAIVLLHDVVERDPEYGDAWRELVRAYINADDWDAARRFVVAAERIDPDRSLGLSGWIDLYGDHNVPDGARRYQQAMAAVPNDVDVLRGSSKVLALLRRPGDVVKLGEYLEARDPYCLTCLGNIGDASLMLGDIDAAEQRFQDKLNLGQGRVAGYYSVGLIRLLQGNPAQALQLFQQERSPNLNQQGVALALHDLGERQQFDTAVGRLVAEWGDAWPAGVAAVYAWTGDSASAFDWLMRRDASAHDPFFGTFVSPLFNALHDDPRWQDYLSTIGVSDAQLRAIGFKPTLPN